MSATTQDKYQVPHRLIAYLCGWNQARKSTVGLVHLLRGMRLTPDEETIGIEDESELYGMAQDIEYQQMTEALCGSIIKPGEPSGEEQAEQCRQRIIQQYTGCVFGQSNPGCPPLRLPFGEAEINIKTDSVPVKQSMFQIQGNAARPG